MVVFVDEFPCLVFLVVGFYDAGGQRNESISNRMVWYQSIAMVLCKYDRAKEIDSCAPFQPEIIDNTK